MKPSLPQGTRDFDPAVLRKRYFITNTIKSFFERYGFDPLETPAMENLDTLMGKYGDEGDQLIFKILNNGLDHPSKKDVATTAFSRVLSGHSDKGLTSRALRYDLTIPFARFVAMNHAQLPMPFRRYQIQPVWRADRPQRGRYREFYQCDADVAGTFSLKADAEFALLYRDVFKALSIPVTIKLNNRKLLNGLAEITGDINAMRLITVAIDKADKVGIEAVKKELAEGGLSDSAVARVEEYLAVSGSNQAKMEWLTLFLQQSEAGRQGLAEVEEVFSMIGDDPVFELDTTLARGLDYYTGTIFEIAAHGVRIGSIGGGGRYDDLTGLFGVKNIPGVGISFGIDRIYDVMEELDLFPAEVGQAALALFFNMGTRESASAFRLMQDCRTAGIACEMYYEKAKLDRQFKFADKKKIRFAIIIGSRELEKGTCMIKNLLTGTEQELLLSDLIPFLRDQSVK